MKKNYILSLVSILFIIVLTRTLFFTKGTNIQKDQKRIAFISPQTDYPVWLQAKDGFLKAADEYDFHGTWLGGGNCDIDDMLEEINSAIYEHVDAIITCPLTPENSQRFLKKHQNIISP